MFKKLENAVEGDIMVDGRIVAHMKPQVPVNLVKWAKAKPEAIIPTKRLEDGGYDVYACFDDDLLIIPPHKTVIVPTGIASAFNHNFVALLAERGSTGTKGIGQRSGVIDSGYRGEWMVPITNHNDIHIVIAKDEVSDKEIGYALTGHKELTRDHIRYPYNKAICQVLFHVVPVMQHEEIDFDDLKAIPSERGDGKLGSSTK